jgi:hypothetical protein
MSLIAEVIKYGKDIVLLGERVDALMAGRKETTARLEDHERRLRTAVHKRGGGNQQRSLI